MAKKQPLTKKNNRKKYTQLGWREWVIFPDHEGFSIKAKIDTGARSSALHATHIKEYEQKGKKWVKFRIHQSTKFIIIETPVLENRKITNSFGVSEKRLVILLKIKLGKKSWNTEITLTRRSDMTYPMLIGRNSLKKKHVVHPHRSYLHGDPSKNS